MYDKAGIIWLIHAVVWQKPTQHCKAIVLQLKVKKKKRRHLVKTFSFLCNAGRRPRNHSCSVTMG